MARPLRITFPGAFYHVTSRGNERADCGLQPVTPGISRFPCKEFAYMLRFSDSAGPVNRSRLRDVPYCLPHQVTRSATRIR